MCNIQITIDLLKATSLPDFILWAGSFLSITKQWNSDDHLALRFPIRLRTEALKQLKVIHEASPNPRLKDELVNLSHTLYFIMITSGCNKIHRTLVEVTDFAPMCANILIFV